MNSNEQAAYNAGFSGYPSPDVVSAHNYSKAEMAAWEEGREDREERLENQ